MTLVTKNLDNSFVRIKIKVRIKNLSKTMIYSTTITKKGQITIPKEIRNILKLEEGKKLDVELEKEKKRIIIKPIPDILDLAGTFKPKRKIVNPVKIREKMVRMYKPR